MGKGFGVGGYGHAPGLDAELLDAETDVDDLSLTSLGHDHAAQRVVVGEVVPNHRLEKLFWWHVVGRLLWRWNGRRNGDGEVFFFWEGDAGEAQEENAAGWTDLLYPVLPARGLAVLPLCS